MEMVKCVGETGHTFLLLKYFKNNLLFPTKIVAVCSGDCNLCRNKMYANNSTKINKGKTGNLHTVKCLFSTKRVQQDVTTGR